MKKPAIKLRLTPSEAVAIIEGRQTQLRRIVEPQPIKRGAFWEFAWGAACSLDHMPIAPGHATAAACPYTPGTSLISPSGTKLDIINTRLEQVRSISEYDAIAQGCNEPLYIRDSLGNLTPPPGHTLRSSHPTARHWFSVQWNTAHGGDAWAANPWVWVIEFKRVEQQH